MTSDLGTKELANQANIEGIELYQKGDSKGAMEAFIRAVHVDPKCATAYNNIGALLIPVDTEKALGCFRNALAINPNEPSALKNIRKLTGDREGQKKEIKELFINHCLSYDNSFEDVRLLNTLGVFFSERALGLCFYGAGKLCRYMFEHIADLNTIVKYIVDDDEELQGENINGVPIISAGRLPDSVNNIFLCSTKYLNILDMATSIKNYKPNIPLFTLGVIEQLDKSVIPERAYKKRLSDKYPINIPEIKFLSNQDIILLALPGRQENLFPCSAGYVHSILKKNGFRLQTIDICVILFHRYHSQKILDGLDKVVSKSGYEMPDDPWHVTSRLKWEKDEFLEYFQADIDKIVKGLVKASPKMVAISLQRTNREFSRKIIAGIREKSPDTVIIVGGYDCRNYDTSPKVFDDFDYMVIGEAETTIGPLVSSILAGDRPKDMPGVLSKTDSPDRKWKKGPLVKDLDTIDFPRYEWTDLSLYSHSFPIVLNRGCAWSGCNFCFERGAWRTRSAKHIADEIEWFVGRGQNFFGFSVSDALGDWTTLRDLAEEIVKRKLKITMRSQLRIDERNDRAFFELLHKAGFQDLNFGVDAWTDRLIGLQHKGNYNMKIVEQNMRDCTLAGMGCRPNVVIGIPGETDDDIDEIIVNLIRNKDYMEHVNSVVTLLLARGSKYHHNPERYNICFHGDKETIYREHPYIIPDNLWYSTEPYIDQDVRCERLRKIFTSTKAAGIAYAKSGQINILRLLNKEDM